MKRNAFLLAAGSLLCAALTASATTRYVNLNNPAPVPPYTNWPGAATNIQHAIDEAVDGDEIIVTNGVYATGGLAVYGTMTNRVAINKAVTVHSVNGPLLTVIEGRAVAGTGVGDGAIRCAYVGTNAVLSGFTLTNGHTRRDGDYYKECCGSGVWCEPSGVVSNCTLSGNLASGSGGGAFDGTLNNCTLSGNSAYFCYYDEYTGQLYEGGEGGGAFHADLNNCNLSNNSAYSGGGASGGTLNNCNLNGNSAGYLGSGGGAFHADLNNCNLSNNSAYDSGGGAFYGTLNNCNLSGNWAMYGGGADRSTLNDCTLSDNSADIGGGASGGTLNNCTLSGNSAYYYGGGASGGTLNNCTLSGNSAWYDGGGAYGSILNNCTLSDNSADWGGGANSGTLNNCIVYYNSAPNGPNHYDCILNYSCTTPLPAGTGNFTEEPRFVNTNGWSNLRLQANSPCINAGNNAYVVGATDLDGNPRINGDTVDVGAYELQPVHYVTMTNSNPLAPYNSWATAATSIQDAIDVAVDGEEIVVADGVYATGGRAVYETMTNRVVIDKVVTVRSVNGPLLAVIEGCAVAETGNGDAAIRCVYVGPNAVLSGFTLTNGHTRRWPGDSDKEMSGGGAWCEPSGVVSNCTLSGNSAYYIGGGAYSGTLNNCTLSGNSAEAGGGADGSTLNNCTLSGNSAYQAGGGASGCTLNNCTLSGNSAYYQPGGGASGCTLNNCTLSGNS
ncbi:MAG TPA: choice-of-anchor Q domain-containing protein, partial [Verrucomicrobiota bacterium]|nr:choice-of-anchor Q domain-containing protein [Verrucomicrobiota bacterium]